MPRHRNRNNQIHFDAGFKACQIASQKEIGKLDDVITKRNRELGEMHKELGQVRFALSKTQERLKRNKQKLVNMQFLAEQYLNKLGALRSILDIKVINCDKGIKLFHDEEATISMEPQSNDNDRNPTRNNC